MNDSIALNKFARGAVSLAWRGNGTELKLPMRHNQLSYACADALAMALGGDITYIPKYIGFIYGPYADPTALQLATDRDQTWGSIGANLADPSVAGNMQISGLSLTPSVKLDGDSELYTANAVVFSAHTGTDSSKIYGFPTSAPYAAQLATGMYMYQAVLLARPSADTYVPIARVTLADPASGAYLQKPSGFELAVEWQVSFF